MKLKLFGTVASEILIAFVALCVAFINSSLNAAAFPSEAFCKDIYFSHKADFNKLQKMLANDSKMQQVGLEHFEPYYKSSGGWLHNEYDHSGTTTFSNQQVANDLSVSVDRLRAYHALCSKIGLRDVARNVDVKSHRDKTTYYLEDGMGRDFTYHFFGNYSSNAWLGPRIEIVYNAQSFDKDYSLAPPGWSLFTLASQKYTTLEP